MLDELLTDELLTELPPYDGITNVLPVDLLVDLPAELQFFS